MIQLGINIDHIATLREARKTYEPDPVFAVQEAILGGADSITIHLREDERHINYRDVQMIRKVVTTRLNLEMSIDPGVVEKALTVKPHQITLVPERRQEITTEGGLDMKKDLSRIQKVIAQFRESQELIVSLFIDPDPEVISLCHTAGADCVEIHTGSYANAVSQKDIINELSRIRTASDECRKNDLGFYAGHGLNYHNIFPLLELNNLAEVNIGHSIIARAIFTGLREAVRDMKNIILRTES